MENKKLIVENYLINYYELIKGNYPYIVFIHGWNSRSEVFFEIANEINANLIFIDLPGFGKSESVNLALGPKDYSDILVKFIKKLSINNIILVGHSFGGTVATLASLNLKITALVLIDNSGIRKKTGLKYLKRFMSKTIKPLFKLPVINKLRPVIYKKMGSDYLESGKNIESYKKIIDEDITSSFKKVNVPTLIIWGEDDRDVELNLGKKMNELINTSTFQAIKNAGHFPFLENKVDFLLVFKDFLKKFEVF